MSKQQECQTDFLGPTRAETREMKSEAVEVGMFVAFVLKVRIDPMGWF
jgi:hypothetical protein